MRYYWRFRLWQPIGKRVSCKYLVTNKEISRCRAKYIFYTTIGIVWLLPQSYEDKPHFFRLIIVQNRAALSNVHHILSSSHTHDILCKWSLVSTTLYGLRLWNLDGIQPISIRCRPALLNFGWRQAICVVNGIGPSIFRMASGILDVPLKYR